MSEIGDRIKALRIANHRTQSEVADYLGITVTGYNNLEYGKTVNLKLSHAQKLAELYNISVNDIYGGAGTREITIRDAMENQPEALVGVTKNMMEQIIALKGIIEEQRRIISDQRYLLEKCLEGKAGSGDGG